MTPDDRGQANHKPLTGVRVVVVEDHLDTREILDQCLRYEGAVVTAVPTAREALAAVGQADVIVTDFLLNGAREDGAWLLELVNQQPRPIPVIVLTGVAEVHSPRLAQAPFACKLLKPLDPWDLSGEILKIVRG